MNRFGVLLILSVVFQGLPAMADDEQFECVFTVSEFLRDNKNDLPYLIAQTDRITCGKNTYPNCSLEYAEPTEDGQGVYMNTIAKKAFKNFIRLSDYFDTPEVQDLKEASKSMDAQASGSYEGFYLAKGFHVGLQIFDERAAGTFYIHNINDQKVNINVAGPREVNGTKISYSGVNSVVFSPSSEVYGLEHDISADFVCDKK